MGKVHKLRVGLTGGIASGKTLVAAMLEVCGAPIAFADAMAKGLMEMPGPVKDDLIALLGPEAYLDTGKLDRQALGQRLFSDATLLAQVNALVHPAVGKAALEWHKLQTDAAYTVYESALLFETGAAPSFDVVVLVHAPHAERLRRAMERDGAERDDILARMEAQWTDEQRLAETSYVILNDGKTSLIQQVWRLHRLLADRKVALSDEKVAS